MVSGPGFSIVYDPAVKDQLRKIDAKHRSLVRRTIEERLSHAPDVESRNRKPLKRPVEFDATWELRFGPANRFRVFYDVDHGQRRVVVLALGVKMGHRLTIGGVEFEL